MLDQVDEAEPVLEGDILVQVGVVFLHYVDAGSEDPADERLGYDLGRVVVYFVHAGGGDGLLQPRDPAIAFLVVVLRLVELLLAHLGIHISFGFLPGSLDLLVDLHFQVDNFGHSYLAYPALQVGLVVGKSVDHIH